MDVGAAAVTESWEVELPVTAAIGAAIADPANKDSLGAVVASSAGPLSSALTSSGAPPKPSILFTEENSVWSLFDTGLSMCAVLLKPPAPSGIPPVASSAPGLEAGGCGESNLAVLLPCSAVPLCVSSPLPY